MPLVSIIIPCHNYGHFLSDTLNCLTDQSIQDWECILVDDGSVDNTRKVCEEYCSEDIRFHYVFQSQSGASAARNKGIELSKGAYIQFLDADDFITKNKIESQLLLMNAETDVVYCDFAYWDQQTFWKEKRMWVKMKHSPAEEYIAYWEKGFSIPIHAYLFRKECFKKWKGFDADLLTHEDLEFQVRFALNGARYKYQDQIQAIYRVHAKSLARDVTKMRRGYLLMLLKTFKNSKLTDYLRLLLLNRFMEELLHAFLDIVKGKKIELSKVLKLKESGTNPSFFLIVFFFTWPFYLLKKIIEIAINRGKMEMLASSKIIISPNTFAGNSFVKTDTLNES